MKIGFITSILDGFDYPEVLDIAKKFDFKCLEVACWPQGKSERRYAGVSHIDIDKVLDSDTYASEILDLSKKANIDISALAFYPNTLDPDLNKRSENVKHLIKVIKASAKLNVNLVTTFIGRDQSLNFEDNLLEVKKVWPSILDEAKEQNVKVAIENCPMLFSKEQWPGGQNLMTSPRNWQVILDLLNSDYLGINYDPSHFIWQMMDYIKPIYEFKDKIFHVHFKDIKILKDKLDNVGIMAYPLEFMSPKLPGLGDVDWGKFVSALNDIRYDGYACIEVEDRAFEGSREKIIDSLELSRRYMNQFVI